MDADRILGIVDGTIISSFNVGKDINHVLSELKTRSINFEKVLRRDPDLNVEKMMISEWDDIKVVKVRYGTFYIRSCAKRIKDLDWISKNKSKFSKYSDIEMFNLVKFKDKLSNTKRYI